MKKTEIQSRRPNDPSPEEIDRMCEEIRASKTSEQVDRMIVGKNYEYETPQVKLCMMPYGESKNKSE